MPSTNKFFQRITQFVKLVADKGKEVKCCQTNNRLRWVKLSHVTSRSSEMNNLWGDEVVSMCRALCSEERAFLTEFDLSSCLSKMDGSSEAQLLSEVKWSQDKVHELLVDYASHLYPSFAMTSNSFRVFISKHGLLSKSDPRLAGERLFRAFAENKESITFTQLLFGLAAMDTRVTTEQIYRVKLIFK